MRLPICRRDGFTLRAIQRSPPGHFRALVIKPVISATSLSSSAAPSWPTVPPREPPPQSRQPHGSGHPDRYRDAPGRACYDRKITEGKTPEEALRALRRRVSDAIFTRLLADARRAAAARPEDPGGQPGNDSVASAADSHPEHRLFGQATPEPATTLRPRRDSRRANISARPATNTVGSP
jgi:hypothetical protein